MRVEHLGDLLLEPSSLRQQPSAISSHCSDHLSSKNIQFSELNQIEVPVIDCKEQAISEDGEQRGVFGFTLSEEEWSLFNKSHLADLEPYERKKMCSLPKSFTPFSSKTVGDGGLECNRNLGRSASNSILLRKCESLNPTPSQFMLNGSEPNNNSIAHPSSLSKILLLHKSQEGFQEDEKENWLSDEGWNKTYATVSEMNPEPNNDAASVGDMRKQALLWKGYYGIGQNESKDREVDVEFLPTTRFPVAQSSTLVGTIGSHPNPIISCVADQAHYHQHQDLSTTQQASFPSTVYNFHSIDPVLYAEYGDWNANVASLCENKTDSTPVLFPDALSVNVNGLTMQPGPESGFSSYAAYGENDEQSDSGGAVEEVNTLSTFLSKFDDKVAAIWGQGSSRSTLGANLLNIDGCISSASTPLGSSNPWGSPSSDISGTHGSSDFRLLQAQQAKQIALAADALLSGGYSLHHQDPYQCEQQGKPQNASKIMICDPTVSPPKGNYNIMHSMKQYFGTAPPESEYHIIKPDEATSSQEEMKKSLASINHDQESAGFVEFRKPQNLVGKQTGIDLKTMAKALDSIDLDNEADDEWEIVEACTKGKSQAYDGEDLLNSWKTHFRTIDQVEIIASARGVDLAESPITAISVHQINPNLPEYRLFDVEVDGEYRVFNRPGHTLFPVKYKVCRQNEKGNQTDDSGVDMTSPTDTSHAFQTYYKMAASQWAKYLAVPSFEFSGALGTLPRSTTPLDPRVAQYECDSVGDFLTSDWYNLPKENEYSGMWGEWAVGDGTSTSLVPGGEYCDSGVGGVGSRSDFYDDMFGDNEGEYENFSGMGFSYPGFVTTNDTDTDYGQFQDLSSSYTGCDASSVSGKQGKSSRRNKARLRPCKYYFLEGSCRRGNDCKFSHDSVTCRYWAEGSCLKGHACPYVHCFIDGKKLSMHEEFGIRNSVTEKQYHLESETDFPALSSTKNTMLSSRQPIELGFSPSMGEGIRRLEDSLESLTVFTDSNSSVVEEEVNETRRLFLFERFRSTPSATVTTEKNNKKQTCDSVKSGKSSNGNMSRGLEHRDRSETSSRTLSKSKSLGDTNTSAPWMRNSVSRSNSHSSTTGMPLGMPAKEKRKKKKH